MSVDTNGRHQSASASRRAVASHVECGAGPMDVPSLNPVNHLQTCFPRWLSSGTPQKMGRSQRARLRRRATSWSGGNVIEVTSGRPASLPGENSDSAACAPFLRVGGKGGGSHRRSVGHRSFRNRPMYRKPPPGRSLADVLSWPPGPALTRGTVFVGVAVLSRSSR